MAKNGIARVGRYIRWENNLPIACYVEPVTTDDMVSIGRAALAVPYEPILDPITLEILPEEKKFVGMTCLEVAFYRASQRFAQGDLDAGKFVFDRTIGKPKQQLETVSLHGTIQDFLAQVAAADAGVTVVDAESIAAITDKSTEEPFDILGDLA